MDYDTIDFVLEEIFTKPANNYTFFHHKFVKEYLTHRDVKGHKLDDVDMSEWIDPMYHLYHLTFRITETPEKFKVDHPFRISLAARMKMNAEGILNGKTPYIHFVNYLYLYNDLDLGLLASIAVEAGCSELAVEIIKLNTVHVNDVSRFEL